MCQALGSHVTDAVIVQAAGDRRQARAGCRGSGPRGDPHPTGITAPLYRGQTEAQRDEATSPWSYSESREATGLKSGSFRAETSVQIPVLPSAAYVTLGKLVNSCVAQFAPP